MNRQEVEQLYREHGASVFRRACTILRNDEDAREAMQDVFITALTRGSTFRGNSAPMTWLYSVTTNLCINRLRNAKRRTELMAEANPGAWTRDLPHPELVQTVHSLLRVVPEEIARAAVYYYFDDMTHAEIAEVMECSRRHVGNLLERFRKRVEQEEVGGG